MDQTLQPVRNRRHYQSPQVRKTQADGIRGKQQKILPIVEDSKLADWHHWTAIALCGWLKKYKELVMSYRTLVRYLHEQDYARRITRPIHEPPDRDKWIMQRGALLPELAKLYNDEQVEHEHRQTRLNAWTFGK